MKYFMGAVVGLVWGFLAELLNCFISKKAIEKNSLNWVILSNALRLLVVVVALGIVFLLHDVSPLSFETTIVGTAAGMSITLIVFAFKTMAGK